MSRLPSLKRDVFLRVLGRLGVSSETARGGGSLVKLRLGSVYDSFHIHPREEVWPSLVAKILRKFGIDPEDFRRAM